MNFKIFFIWLLSVGVAFSAPSISSVTSVADGESATISGASFGAMGTATPDFFDTFDANDAGRQNSDTIYSKNCSNYGTWDNDYLDSVPTYTNANQRDGSILSSYHHLICNDIENNHAYITSEVYSGNTTGYIMSFWLRMEWDSIEYSYVGDNIKMFRVNDGDSEADLHTSLQVGTQSGNPLSNQIMMVFIGGSGANWPIESDTTLNYTYTEGSWRHYIVAFHAGTDGNADGDALIWVDGSKLEDTTVMETFETGDQYDAYTFCYYCANFLAGNVYMQFDDIYIDDTWQTVWLGNNSLWNNCTVREVQLQTARSDTSITITVNQGAFTDTAYVYVMDADGAVNASGYEVSFSAQSAETFTLKKAETGSSMVKSGTGCSLLKGE